MAVHVSQLVPGRFYHCVGVKPSADSFRPQPLSSWSTASFSTGLTTATAYWRVCQLDRNQSVLSSAAHFIYGRTHPIIQPICCVTTSIGCVFPSGSLISCA